MEFGEFILAVFNSWVEKVGLILTILPFIDKLPKVKEWLGDKSIIDRFNKVLWTIGGLCIIWGFYSAWDDQYRAASEAQNKLNQLRPYLVMEELTPEQIQSIALRNPSNPKLPNAEYGHAYTIVQTSQQESLLFNCRNVGKLPAKKVTFYQKIINTGSGEVVPVLPSKNGETVLYPDQSIMRFIAVPQGTFFTNISDESRKLHIKLVVTYSGDLSDKNTYFYEVVLIARRFTDMPQMNSSFGGFETESTDEGIIKDLLHVIE